MLMLRITPKGVTESTTFAHLVERSFKEVDYDNNSKLDSKELHIALLLLYDKINSLLPVHMKVPTREEVEEYLKRYDTDNSGGLEYPEFLEFCKALFGGRHRWRDSVLLRAMILMIMNLLVWPLAGSGAKRGVMALGLGSAAMVPAPVWTIASENVVKTIRGTVMK